VSGLLIALIGVGALVAVVLVLRRLSGAPSYSAVLSAAHCMEVAERLVAVKAAALGRIQAGDLPPEATPDPADARRVVSSAGLRIFYTITGVQERFIHHYSISVGNYTPHAVGRTFALYIGRVLGAEPARIQVARSSNAVWHVVFELSAEEHQEYAARPVEVPSSERAAELYAECFRDGHSLDLQQFTTRTLV
jgi:hypothetical protein